MEPCENGMCYPIGARVIARSCAFGTCAQGGRSNPHAMNCRVLNTRLLSYGMEQRGRFVLHSHSFACAPHRSHTVVRGLLRPSARSQRAARNDGCRGQWNLRRLAYAIPSAPASLRGAGRRHGGQGAEAISVQ
jgi:hypothetical protein